MHHSNDLFQVLIFLSAAVIAVPIFRRLSLSPILGYLTAGLIIGPHSLGLIEDTDAAHKFAEFGVVFLLFMIGLELSIDRLKTLGWKVFGLGSSQVLITGLIIGAIAWSLGVNLNAATIIGGGLALSSTAFVLQLLTERSERATPYGLTTFSILLLQDLAVVPLLLLVSLLGSSEASFLEAFGMSALKGGAALILIIAFGRFFLRPLFHVIAATRNSELFVSTTLLIVLGMGWAMSQAGLSMELGALFAGVLLAETEYKHQIEADIKPFRGILLGLFFMTIGMLIDVFFIINNIGTITLIVISLLVGKTVIITALCRLFQLPLSTSIRTGFALSQGGEFGFVLFGAALALNIISPHITQILLAVIAITMLLTPLMFYMGHELSNFIDQKSNQKPEPIGDEIEALNNHILIAGFGRVGQTVAKVVSDAGYSYVALDLDHNRVKKCRSKTMQVYYGDASQIKVLEAAGISKATSVVVTLDNQAIASKTVAALRAQYQDLPIYVRARDRKHIQHLETVGATAIVSEAAESSLQLGSIILSSLDVSTDEITSLIDKYRDNEYERLEEIIDG
ncbi:MAG: cation:proton antiporter [Rhizobiales bacterium]|nr:cation:proton antiporter [Hyphomicrobiales bacterium]